MIKKFIFIILLTVSIGAALTMSKRIIDDIYLVYAVGYEYVDDNKIRGTVAAPIFKETKKVTNMTFTHVSSLIYENREKIEAEASKPLYSGKLEVALYNTELAENGIFEMVDNLQRDPSVGTRVNLAITHDSTVKILNDSYEEMTTGKYISDMIEQNSKDGNLPITNLKTFTTSYFMDGKDPILPIINKRKDKLQIDGLAIFNEDKMVAEIPFTDSIYLKALMEDFRRGVAIVNLSEKKRASISGISSNRKFQIINQYSNPKVILSLNLKGFIREYSGKYLSEKIIKEFEKKMGEDFEKKSEEMIQRFQELGADPVGIGEQIRRKTYGFNQKKWDDLYPTVDIKVNAKVEILEHGVVK